MFISLKRNNRWRFRPGDLPSEEVIRQMPELEGMDQNPWLLLFMAGAGENIQIHSPLKVFLIWQALTGAIIFCLFAAFLGWPQLFYNSFSSVFWNVFTVSQFALLMLAFMFTIMNGAFLLMGTGPIFNCARGKTADAARELYLATTDHRQVALGCLARVCGLFCRESMLSGLTLSLMQFILLSGCVWFAPAFKPMPLVMAIPLASFTGLELAMARAWPQRALRKITRNLVGLSAPGPVMRQLVIAVFQFRPAVPYFIPAIMGLLLMMSSTLLLLPWLMHSQPGRNIVWTDYKNLPLVIAPLLGLVTYLVNLRLNASAQCDAGENLVRLEVACRGVMHGTFGDANEHQVSFTPLRWLRQWLVDPIRLRPRRFLLVTLPHFFLRVVIFTLLGGYVYLHTHNISHGLITTFHDITYWRRNPEFRLRSLKWLLKEERWVWMNSNQPNMDFIIIGCRLDDAAILDELSRALLNSESFDLTLGIPAEGNGDLSPFLSHPVAIERMSTLTLSGEYHPTILPSIRQPLRLDRLKEVNVVEINRCNILKPIHLRGDLDEFRATSSFGLAQTINPNHPIKIAKLQFLDISHEDQHAFLTLDQLRLPVIEFDPAMKMTDMTDFAAHPELESLSLNDAPLLTTLKGMEQVKGLKRITLHDAPMLADISALAECLELQMIEIWGCPQVDESMLAIFQDHEHIEDFLYDNKSVLRHERYQLPPVPDATAWSRKDYIETEARWIEGRIRWPETLHRFREERRNEQAQSPAGRF